MPEKDIIMVKKPKPEVLALSGLLVLGGLGAVLLAMKAGGGGETIRPIPDGKLEGLGSPNLDAAGTFQISRTAKFAALLPYVHYIGTGRSVYSFFQIKQLINGEMVTVFGSGVAGVFLAPAAILTQYALVSAQEVQPPGCPSGQNLCAEPWPGNETTPICGAPPRVGPADAVLEIYQNATQSGNPADADGFSSPTCMHDGRLRIWIAQRVYKNKIQFI